MTADGSTTQKKNEITAYFILVSAPILLTIYYYNGNAESFLTFFPGFSEHPLLGLYKVLFQFTVFFFLFFCLPLLFNMFYMKKPLKELGLGLGDVRLGLKLTLPIILLLVLPAAYLASQMADVRSAYPMARILMARHDLLTSYDLAYVLLYYVAWEFYFRGFMLFGTREALGDTMAIVVQTIPSCLIHLGKPEGETIGAVAVGIIFGFIAVRTRSIWYVFLIHASLGILTDLFIIFF